MTHVVHVSNHQPRPIDAKKLRQAVRTVLKSEGFRRVNVSVAVVNDSTILDVNRRFLAHSEPTDVISFLFSDGPHTLEGEIVASAQTAATAARQFHSTPDEELLLYVIHGALHLAGYDDRTAVARRAMRKRERHYMAQFGLEPRYEQAQKPAPKARRTNPNRSANSRKA